MRRDLPLTAAHDHQGRLLRYHRSVPTEPNLMRKTSSPATRLGIVALMLMLAWTTGMVLKAASPIFWRVTTQEDFLRGRVENLTIDSTGQVQLGPKSEVVFDTTAPFLWTAVLAQSTLWVGSGNDGKVFAISADGSGDVVFDAGELNIHAVVPRDDSSAYVASSPHGKVYEVTTTGREPRVVFDPDEQYIWAMAQASGDSDVFVATGEPGRIYRVTPDGEASLFYETRAAHVLTLAFDSAGNLLAGTGTPGRVFRISPDGRGFVVLDSPFSEIRSLRLAADDRAFAVAVSASPGRNTSTAAATTSNTTETTGVSATTTVSTSVTVSSSSTGTSTGSAAGSSPTAGAVYKIDPDGVWDTVWESSTDTPYDVAFDTLDEEPGILIGTGGDGKIFRVLENPYRVVLVTSAPAKQVTRLVSAGDGSHYFLTANPGNIHRLEAGRSTTGRYTSDVRDASTVATWGTVRWHAMTPADTTVRLFTRSGNTDRPDDTWSPWSDPYHDASGSAISSPKARYVQWRAELSGATQTPSLLAVTTAYLPRNLRPEITDVTVHEPGVVFQQPFSGTDPPIAGLGVGAEIRPAAGSGEGSQRALGRRVYMKGLQTFVWTARDGNQDTLEYSVRYRSESDPTWRTLTSESRDSIFTWNTTSTPDGTYTLRILATDAPSNAPGSAETGFADSAPFDIDNTAPEIAVDSARPAGQHTIVPVLVRDAHSPVHRVEYSLDTDRWQVVYPLDGIPDSQTERFEITIANEALDDLIIRATDTLGNTATAAGT